MTNFVLEKTSIFISFSLEAKESIFETDSFVFSKVQSLWCNTTI